MNTITAQKFIHRHPVTVSVLVIATAGAVEILLKATIDLLSVQLPVITVGIISGALLSLLGGVTLTRLGLWRELGLLGRPVQPRALLWLVPFVIHGVLPLTEGFHVSADKAAAALAFGMLIAFWKLVVLAVLFYAWLPHGARCAAAATALGWASMHLGGILTGAPVVPTLLLSLSYLFLAFAFVAVRLRTGVLWPLLATYALLLTTAVAVQKIQSNNLVPSVTHVLHAVGISILLAVYGLLAWPRHKHPTYSEFSRDRANRDEPGDDAQGRSSSLSVRTNTRIDSRTPSVSADSRAYDRFERSSDRAGCTQAEWCGTKPRCG
jgi:hypothetical protein